MRERVSNGSFNDLMARTFVLPRGAAAFAHWKCPHH